MGLDFDYISGQTPLDEEECDGLKISTISTKGELDEFEQKNIEQAVQWTIGRKIKIDSLLSEKFIRSLHQRMYGEVWKWTGVFRKSEKNIGVESWKISTDIRILLDDVKFWIKNEINKTSHFYFKRSPAKFLNDLIVRSGSMDNRMTAKSCNSFRVLPISCSHTV